MYVFVNKLYIQNLQREDMNTYSKKEGSRYENKRKNRYRLILPCMFYIFVLNLISTQFEQKYSPKILNLFG